MPFRSPPRSDRSARASRSASRATGPHPHRGHGVRAFLRSPWAASSSRARKLSAAPDHSQRVELPRPLRGPLGQVTSRLLLAVLVLATAALIVYLGRDGYTDGAGGEMGLVDAVYYTTVTLSTTGYGDVVPTSESARLFNIFLITPLRVLFLIILVGTTLEVLTERTREQWRLSRWRSSLRDHTVIVGFGTKGRSAAETLLTTGLRKDQMVVVDPSPRVVEAANADGFAGVVGDGTRNDVLARALTDRARQVVIATQRDDTAVLVTLSARQLNQGVKIIAAVREEENAPLLRQSGADTVILSSSAAGRLMGLSMLSPSAGAVMEDLINQGTGLMLTERPVTKAEAGRSPRECPDLVISVIRGHRLLDFDHPEARKLQLMDRLVVIRRSAGSPEHAPAPQGPERAERPAWPPRPSRTVGSWRAPRDELGQEESVQREAAERNRSSDTRDREPELREPERWDPPGSRSGPLTEPRQADRPPFDRRDDRPDDRRESRPDDRWGDRRDDRGDPEP